MKTNCATRTIVYLDQLVVCRTFVVAHAKAGGLLNSGSDDKLRSALERVGLQHHSLRQSR